MPPRVKLPHGLTKDPRLMSTAEKGIFGLLAASIGLGVYRLATSPWGEQEKKNSVDKNDTIKNMGSEMNTTVQPTVLEISQDLKPTKSTLTCCRGWSDSSRNDNRASVKSGGRRRYRCSIW